MGEGREREREEVGRGKREEKKEPRKQLHRQFRQSEKGRRRNIGS